MDFRFGYSWLKSGGIIAIVLGAVVWYASFNFNLPARYNSPDEAANAFFAARLAGGQWLPLPAPLNEAAGRAIIHPRSTVVYNQQIIPASFLGWPLTLGLVGRLLGQGIMLYLAPLFAIVGLVFFYLIVLSLTNRRAAVIALILLAALPAYWYYHSRSFFHNAAFIDLLLVVVWCGLKAVRTNRARWFWWTGLAGGLALSLRTAEIFWLFTAAVIWFSWFRRQISLKYLWLTLAGGLAGLAPIFISNYFIYGFPLSFGYQPDLFLLPDIHKATSLVGELILPFGFSSHTIKQTIVNYLLSLTWWWALLALAGVAWAIFKWRELSREFKALLITSLIISLWLVVVYGSWSFSDNPDPRAITLGTSYMRYFLPLLALSLIPAAAALARLTYLKLKLGQAAVVLIIGVYLLLSLNIVWFDSQEGLSALRQNIKRFQQTSWEVQNLTPTTAVIVSGRTDKFFWPERAVIYELKTPADYAAVRQLLKRGWPVYNFHPTWPPAGLAQMNKKLLGFNLRLQPVKYGWQDFSLYEIKLVNL